MNQQDVHKERQVSAGDVNVSDEVLLGVMCCIRNLSCLRGSRHCNVEEALEPLTQADKSEQHGRLCTSS
jgi:hypothetical protein